MTITSSGNLNFTIISAEFGGSAPHSLSEYYAGGGLVPSGATGTNGAVPSSGQFSFSKLYGTSTEDLNPNALNWTDVSISNDDVNAEYPTNTQTITGISSPITLAFDYTLVDSGGGSRFVIWKNGTVQSNTSLSGLPASGSFLSLSVANNDQVFFQITKINFSEGDYLELDLTVKNQSQSNTVLDTVNFFIQFPNPG